MYEIADVEKRAYRERRRLYGHINFLCKPVDWRGSWHARESDCKSAAYLLAGQINCNVYVYVAFTSDVKWSTRKRLANVRFSKNNCIS